LDKLLYDKTQHISEEQKIRWVHEIALGMCHLHQHNIVHRDLAARNMLLSHSNPAIAQLKISDFGMSRVLQQDIESKTKSGTGPVCWMAPESIAKKIYSKKSDVWMFGVLIYEIVARCEPHGDKDPLRTSVEIRESYITPDIPRDCPMRLRELMEMCWQKQPDQRPSFEAIVAILSNSVSHVSETQYTDI
jgi:serine/threonine protein kinase